MRKYQPIWNEIKLNCKASITANPSLHRRIITAVRKEKVKDLGWKLLLTESTKPHIKYELKEKIRKEKITFYLVDITPPHINDL